ncbi:DUF6885 family protein [Phormidesmis sp. 146-35]
MQHREFSIELLPGMSQAVSERQLAGQQQDNLCGPYWASLLLRSRRFSISPAAIARSAGSVLPIGDASNWLPRGALSRQDYELALPETDRLQDAGTSAQGLIEAVSEHSQNAYCLVPLRAEWSAERVEAVLKFCHQADWEMIPLCNLRTSHLWGSQLSVSDAIAYLKGNPISAPPADWNVGHFLILAGTVKGEARSLVLVCDTYPTFGWQGYHLQPFDAIAQALNRGDGCEGGILLFANRLDQSAIEQHARQQGFVISIWDNGSPSKPHNQTG